MQWASWTRHERGCRRIPNGLLSPDSTTAPSTVGLELSGNPAATVLIVPFSGAREKVQVPGGHEPSWASWSVQVARFLGKQYLVAIGPLEEFQNMKPEFWATVKFVSQEIGYSHRKAKGVQSRPRAYSPEEVLNALKARGLEPRRADKLAERVAWYSTERADLLANHIRPNLMEREEARSVFEQMRDQFDPPAYLLPMNKQKGEKRHFAYLTCIVNMLTWVTLGRGDARATFDWDPRGPLTFSKDGLPQRTLFRRMDGAYPGTNHPYAAWEIKEYYDTKTFGSRVADGVYESALDGYELNDLREVGVEVEHILIVDDRYTWWDCGKPYLCRIVDMLHVGLLDAAVFGREVLTAWPDIVSAWPRLTN